MSWGLSLPLEVGRRRATWLHHLEFSPMSRTWNSLFPGRDTMSIMKGETECWIDGGFFSATANHMFRALLAGLVPDQISPRSLDIEAIDRLLAGPFPYMRYG
jgi:hypothetical protein